MELMTINLEAGKPTVEAARIQLEAALRHAKSQKKQVLKFIHGYGSSGPGGAIKRDTAKVLAAKKKAGLIQEYVAGEDFSPFHPAARNMLTKLPELSKDRDYSRGNAGITLVML